MKQKIFISKSFNDIKQLKNNFYKKNYELLKQAENWNRIYSKQSRRLTCKNCNYKLPKKVFSMHFANYTICKKCSHLNGLNNDTDKFNDHLYRSHNTKFTNFYDKNYNLRVKKISKPKLSFLKKILNLKNKKIIDIGCGAGNFVKACENEKIECIGYEPNRAVVNFGRKYLKKNKIINVGLNDYFKIIKNSNANVISLLGVLEHLSQPNKFFEAFNNSKAEYIFLTVPLMSFSVILENAFENVYPRVLGGVHNHLYTEKSLKFLFKKYKLKVIGEWWFGSDMMDLHRFISVSQKSNKKNTYKKLIDRYFTDILDDLQNVLDKNKLCSDVHYVLRRN